MGVQRDSGSPEVIALLSGVRISPGPLASYAVSFHETHEASRVMIEEPEHSGKIVLTF